MSYLSKLSKKFEKVRLSDKNLDDYQWQAVETLRNNPKFALFIDTGLGKTAISLRVIRDLLDADEISKVLIIAPIKVANQTWGDEIQTWEYAAPIPYKLLKTDAIKQAVNEAGRLAKSAPIEPKVAKRIDKKVETRMAKIIKANPNIGAKQVEMIRTKESSAVTAEYRKFAVMQARMAEYGRQLRQSERENPAIIHIIHHENNNIEELVTAWGNDWPYDCIIYDESDAIKDASTKRWKALNSVSHRVKRFYQLTATPAAENYLGLYAQIKLLDGGKRLGNTFTEYKQRFFDENVFSRKITIKDGAAEKITELVSDISLVMKQEEYLKDVAPVRIENICYELPENARKCYNEIRSSGQLAIGGNVIVAEAGAAIVQKMMQIAAGFVYDTADTLNDFGNVVAERTIYPIHTAKADALRGLMARFPDQNFLIAYYHQGSLEMLQREFPEAVKMDRQGTQKQDWNDGKIKMLLMHPRSGAHGLNLQYGGHIVINFDVYFSYTLFYQFYRRLARRGQKHHEVLVFNLLGKKTYDEYVQRSCWVEKRDAQGVFFDMLKGFQKCR